MAAYLAIRVRSHGKREKIRQKPLKKSEVGLIYGYRLSRAAILELCDILKEDLQPSIRSTKALTLVKNVLIALKLLVSGSLQGSAEDNLNVAHCEIL